MRALFVRLFRASALRLSLILAFAPVVHQASMHESPLRAGDRASPALLHGLLVDASR